MLRKRFNVVGIMILKLRCNRGWTQDDLVTQVQLLGFPLSRQQVAHLEAGRCRAADLAMLYIAKALGVRAEDLFPPALRNNPDLELLEILCDIKPPRNAQPDEETRRAN